MSLGPTAQIIMILKKPRPGRFGPRLSAECFAPLEGSCLQFSWGSAALLHGSPTVSKESTWSGPKLHRLPNGSLPQAPTGLRLFRLQVLQKPRGSSARVYLLPTSSLRLLLLLALQKSSSSLSQLRV